MDMTPQNPHDGLCARCDSADGHDDDCPIGMDIAAAKARSAKLTEALEAMDRKRLADAKAEGRREGILAAKKACDNISEKAHWPGSAVADRCADAIEALLAAPSEAKETT